MMMLKNGKYFKYSELLKSETAEENNIDNTPKDETTIDNINYTISRLDEIREGYGKPIVVTSGYRCEELNILVGGVKDSKHKNGLGVDLKWDKELVEYIVENGKFDKLIREKSGNTKWIHLQFKKNKDEERGIVLYINL